MCQKSSLGKDSFTVLIYPRALGDQRLFLGDLLILDLQNVVIIHNFLIDNGCYTLLSILLLWHNL